ncbi:MAG: nucleoside phosphorylase [Chloroflexi bacterium]|nr:nucleoside phosphorylase [Chloroflexota bacterium]
MSLQPNAYPILEHDPTRRALLEPQELVPRLDLPKRCVLSFFGDRVRRLAEQGRARQVCEKRSEMGTHPVYVISHQGEELVLMQPGISAPFAAAFLEELIARGCEKFIVCGGAGVLDRQIVCGHLLVPDSALRDEGTSYHYLPPSREVAANPQAVAAIESVLAEHDLPYLRVKTWTTDAFYRETPARIAARRAEGCLCVEMEAAALFAVAQFRGVLLGQLLYGGDDVSGSAWDSREWYRRHDLREQMIWLAAEACLRL